MACKKVKLLGKKLLIKEIFEPVRQGKLYIPNPERTFEGIVIGVGDELEGSFDEGDRILYEKYSGQKFNGNLLITSADVLGKITR